MRNKIVCLFGLLFLLAGCSAQKPPVVTPPPVNKDFAITAKWNEDFTNYFACSATVTSGCIQSFTWGYLSGAANTPVPLKTSAVTVCTGTTQPEACTDTTNSQLPIGNVTFYIVVNYINNAGVASATTAVNTATPVITSVGVVLNFGVTAQ
jgi:hypothetical protein